MNVIVVGGDTNTVIVQQEPPKQVVVQAPGPSMLVGALRWDIAQTLTSPQQAQARSNMGFAAAVIATALAGFSAAAGGTITSADTVLSAFGKVEYRLADLEDGALTGPLTITANSSSAALTLVNNGAGLALTTTGGITAGAFTGPLTGNVTGNITGSSGSTTGNAATATALQTARAINGVNFDGTGAITITAAAGTLTGATLNATVTASSLTSLGTLSSLAVGGAQTITLNSASAGLTITQAGAGAALTANAQIVSTLATGTAPFSVASTTNVANLNASSLNGATFAAPGTIGGGTPGAATFTTLTANTQGIFPVGSAGTPSVKIGNEQNGFYSSTTNTLDLTLNGVRQVQFGYTASAVNFARVTGSATGLSVVFGAGGSDTNVPTVVTSKGGSPVGIYTNTGGNAAGFFQHVASAVNRIDFYPSTTGNAVGTNSDGSDTNVGYHISTKGTSPFRVFTGSYTSEGLRVTHVASAVNYFNVFGAATTGSVYVGTAGSDANSAVVLYSKGSGAIGLCTNSGGNPVAFFQHTASLVNFWQFYGGAAGGALQTYASGSDSDVSVVQNSKGWGAHLFRTNGGLETQFRVDRTASAVNFPTVTGGTVGNPVAMQAQGSDTNVALGLYAKANATVYAVTNGALSFVTANPVGAVNYLDQRGSATGNPITLSVAGSDTNRSMTLTTAGTGTVRFNNKIYPGTPAAATQTAAGLSGGTGAPSNSDASDGDFYFRSDGGALTSIYHKRAGAWVGIV